MVVNKRVPCTGCCFRGPAMPRAEQTRVKFTRTQKERDTLRLEVATLKSLGNDQFVETTTLEGFEWL